MATSEVIKYTNCNVKYSITHGYAPPIYYECPRNNKQYIIICASRVEGYIYLYDIAKNDYIPKYEYPANFDPKHHHAALHQETNQLYIIGGLSRAFAILNMTTNKWTIHNHSNNGDTVNDHAKYDNLQYYDLVYPRVIDNKIHLFYHKDHFIFDIIKDKFIDASFTNGKENSGRRCGIISTPTPKLLLYGGEFRDWAFMFGDDDDEFIDGSFYSTQIQSLEITPNDKYEWKTMHTQLRIPRDPELYTSVIGFGSVLFVFSLETREVHCLDLLATNKWYKCEKQMFLFGESIGSGVVVDGNNDVHFMLYRGVDERSSHVKFSLYDAIPDELVTIYGNYYKLLVHGWLRRLRQDNKMNKLRIPNELKDLIAYFYPCFI